MSKDHFDTIAAKALGYLKRNPMLHRLHELNPDQLRDASLQFFFFVNNFPRYLGAVLWRVEDESIRIAVAENLIDEMGGISHVSHHNTSHTHPQLYRQFLYAQGLDDQAIDSATPKPYTQRMLNLLEAVMSFGHPAKVLGAVCVGVEGIFGDWVKIVYDQLLQLNRFSSDDLIYFSLHTVVDIAHREIFKNTLQEILDNPQTRQHIEDGAMSMVKATSLVFDGIYEELTGSATHLVADAA